MMQPDDIEVVRLTHPSGYYIEVCNYGASWLSAYMPDRDGQLGEILLGYNDIEAMLADPNYAGRTVGRFANRIRQGKFTLDGRTYQLELNDGNNSNHSGPSGLSFRKFDIVRRDQLSVTFHYLSSDGEGGFPANVDIYVTYGLTKEDCQVVIDYSATTDAPTVLNLTNHAYFNLNGYGDIYSHQLRVSSTQMLETDSEFLPTGKVLDVAGSPFDFSQPKPIGRDIDWNMQQFAWNRGYNHCYMWNREKPSNLIQAELSSEVTGRRLSLYSTYSALQIYSGGFLSSKYPTRFGRIAQPADGIALEAQFAPDTPNLPAFPQCTLNPEEKYWQRIIYRFQTFE
ncbi:MAG: galactose mutarotase [Paludibacteraceae bacterium]|nr:galactose mutarotase [Paludibacteraceae bacterium]